jgi:Na+-driven multidrug efflux pump
VPILINWLGFLGVRIPLAYFLTNSSLDFGSLGVVPGWNLGLFGAWIAMCLDIWVRGIIFAIRFLSGKWKKVEV